jgi:hypothetical protein
LVGWLVAGYRVSLEYVCSTFCIGCLDRTISSGLRATTIQRHTWRFTCGGMSAPSLYIWFKKVVAVNGEEEEDDVQRGLLHDIRGQNLTSYRGGSGLVPTHSTWYFRWNRDLETSLCPSTSPFPCQYQFDQYSTLIHSRTSEDLYSLQVTAPIMVLHTHQIHVLTPSVRAQRLLVIGELQNVVQGKSMALATWSRNFSQIDSTVTSRAYSQRLTVTQRLLDLWKGGVVFRIDITASHAITSPHCNISIIRLFKDQIKLGEV